MAMSESARQAMSPALFAFLDYLQIKGYCAPSMIGAEVIADLFRKFFDIPTPMGVCDTSTLLHRFQYTDKVWLQPGLEKEQRIRGWWHIEEGHIVILLEPGRPEASKIKVVAQLSLSLLG